MISIVIPFYNRADLVHNRMYELFQFAPKDCEVILIDDCSTETDTAGIVSFWQKHGARHDIRYKRLANNVGFLKACNEGARRAKGEIVVLLSDDVVVKGDVFTVIENTLKEKPKALVGGRVIDWDSGWNTFLVNGKSHTCAYLEGWLLACTKTTWDELGGFDERFAPNDMEDVDLSATAVQQGRELVPLNLPYLSHLSGATINLVNPQRMELTQRNKKKFIEKWKLILESGSKDDAERGDAGCTERDFGG